MIYGKFYYGDVIIITITQAKGEGNGHVYHIEVRDLPFHRIPFVSCLISLINNTKKNKISLKSNKQNCDNLSGSKFAGQSIVSFGYSASFDAQPWAVRAYNDGGRCLSSQDYASIARTQWYF